MYIVAGVFAAALVFLLGPLTHCPAPEPVECPICTDCSCPNVPEPINNARDPRVFAGLDYSVQLPNLVVNRTNKYELDKGSTLYPALDLIGSMRIRGATVAECPFYVRMDDGSFFDLCFFASIAKNIAGVVCGDCVHGVTTLPNCTCECEPHWELDECNVSTCYEKGVWNVERGRCTCEGDYDASTYCAFLRDISLPLTHDECLSVGVMAGENSWSGPISGCGTATCTKNHYMYKQGDDVYCSIYQKATPTPAECGLRGSPLEGGGCLCKDGYIGPLCTEQCASSTIGCVQRPNWGWSWQTTVSGLDVRVCGGGYQFEDDEVVQIAYLAGSNNTEWEADAPICCAPGIMCSKTICETTDPVCCSEATDRQTCHYRGCSWCGTVCGPTAYAVDCEQPSVFRIEGEWHIERFPCLSDVATSICDLATRAEYLKLYAVCSETGWTRACLETVFAQVDARAWPRLAQDSVYNPSVLYTIIANETLQYLSMGPIERSGALALWSDVATRLYLVPSSTQRSETSPEYYIHASPSGSRYCLVKPPTSPEAWQMQVQLFGATEGGENTLYWRNIDDTLLSLDASAYCGSYVLSNNTVLSKNESLVTSDTESPLTLTILQSHS